MANFYARYPVIGGGEGVATYANYASLPATATDGTLAVTLDTYNLYVYDGSTMMWVLLSTPGSGVTMIGTIDTQVASSNGAVISGSDLYMQSASVSDPGLVNLTTQSFAGNKTFTGTIAASNFSGSSSGTNSGDVTIGTANGLSLSGQILSLAQFTSTTPGAVSLSGGGTSNFLRADGTWAAPAGTAGITALTGDGTATGPGSAAFTLATVATAGTTGSSTAIPVITINAKGLTTSITTAAVVAPAGTLSGTTLASNVVTSSLTTVGTIGTGVWNGTTIAIANGGTGQTTANAALNALLPSQTGNSGLFLTTNGSNTSWASAGGSGSGFNYLSSNTSVYGGTNSTLSFTGADNTVVGVSAGNALTSGADNVILGYNAVLDATTPSQSVFIGSKVGQTTILTGASNVVIGYNTNLSAAQTQAVIIGAASSVSANGTVSIGYDCSVSALSSIGIGAGISVSGSTAVGIGSSSTIIGEGSIGIGTQCYVNAQNSICIGFDNYDSNATGTILLGSCEPGSSSYTNCFIVAQLSGTHSRTAVASAANQIIFGSAGSYAQPYSSMYLGRGAVGDGTATNFTISATPIASGNSNITGASLTITDGNGTGTGGSGGINFQTAPAAASSSTPNTPATYVSISNKGSINSAAPQTTLTGTVGTAICSQPFQGSSYKKAIIYLSGYTDTGTQIYTFPTAFTNTPYVYGLSAGVSGATVSTTQITFATTTVSGFVFVEGY